MSSTQHVIDLSDIRAARSRIAGGAHVTPVFTCETFNKLVNEAAAKADPNGTPQQIQLFFKCENLQKIGAFKFRGALNAVKLALEANGNDKRLVVVTHSSGNHAQALALAARECGLKSVIVMPKNAPQVKVDAVRGYGGEVVFCESTQAARETAANEQVEKYAPYGKLVPPYDYKDVMAGQGTIALEFMEQVPNLDALVVPVGGGGMCSGVVVGAKGLDPHVKFYAAEPKAGDDAFQSITNGTYVPLPSPTSTVADGLRTSLGHLTYPILQDLVDGVIVVEEDEIVRHMKLVFERLKLVIEPSAAVGVAAVMSKQFHTIKGEGAMVRNNNPKLVAPSTPAPADRPIKKIGIVLCGGNVDLDALPWVKK